MKKIVDISTYTSYLLDGNYYIRLHVLTIKQTSSGQSELYKSV